MENIQVSSLIDKIIAGDSVSAKEDFDALLANKVTAALEVRKQEIAQSLYVDQVSNTEEESEENV
jgi:hypothetical protein